jgi:mono/diheme cytochrome c family protein
MRFHHLILPAAALAAGFWLHGGQTQPAPPADTRALARKYCVGCHNAQTKSPELALEKLTAQPVAANPKEWEKAVRKLRARQMPPAGAPRPDEETYRAWVSTLETALDAAFQARPDPGRTDTFRRLTRTEYQNAVRDLLAVTTDVSALLPADETSHGFDNITVGDLSPTLLERYLSAARKVSRLAVGAPIKSPGGDSILLPPDLTQEEHFEGLPLGTRGGTTFRYTFPLDATYEIQIRLQRDRNEHVEGLYQPQQVELLLDGERVKLFTVEPPPPGKDHSGVDRHMNVRLPVKAGPRTIAVAFPKRASVLLETERQPYQAHFNMDRHPRINTALFSVTINGPYEALGAGSTPSRRRIFVCREQTDECAERIFSRLVRLAYRRPASPADIQAPMKFYREARASGDFESGIEMGLRSILVSPEFLFRIEQDPPGMAPGSAYRVSGIQLASRLSFFLWSSIPDEELLWAAERNELHKADVLEKHVRRMLADRRSAALVNNFADQWLHLRNLASMTPDMRLFPDFDENLRQAFRKETRMLFESIMREDRSVLDLLRPGYTFVNERLARHYGIPGVYGSRFRRVTHEGRGGLLRHGSVLTVTSYATRTSPVIRGKWVLDNLIGVPPPPPPAAVPALKENQGVGKVLPVRERLAEHRDNPACSGCHQLMDPVGFALERYDAVGRWRELEDGLPIDSSGALPDGSTFDGVDGLEKALLARPELIASTFTEKLLTYALGRGVEYYDAPAVRKVIREAAAKDYRFSAVVIGIVNSVPFQGRRTQ